MRVKTNYGDVEGTERDGICVFRGIPFAAPPVGDLRFRAPQPPESWTGIREATEPRPAAPQVQESMFPAMAPREIDEDCLYLNVFTPAADTAKRPVMVWIHGGGFMSGAATLPWYNGTSIAANQDVVVVTINYRLGPLGFLYLGELGNDDVATSNLGMRDQIAALEWVRDNIEAFGGDSGNVTIFGESAGGMSVGTLLGIPAAKGLFHKAIMQSGAAHNTFSAEEATVIAERFCEMVEIDPTDTAALLAADWRNFLAKYPNITAFAIRSLAGLLPFQPVVDGDLIPKPARESIVDGLSSDVPVMVGTTEDEFNLFAIMDTDLSMINESNLAKRLELHFTGGDGSGRDHARRIWETYEKELGPDGPISLALMTDIVFRLPAIKACEFQSQHQPATYQYLFAYKSPAAPNGKTLGSFHGLDIPFVFGVADKPAAAFLVGDGPAVPALSKRMQDAWASFARDGKPSANGLPDWPAYELEKRGVMILDADPRIESDPESVRREAWEELI